jgi:hypothetical protein
MNVGNLKNYLLIKYACTPQLSWTINWMHEHVESDNSNHGLVFLVIILAWGAMAISMKNNIFLTKKKKEKNKGETD